MAFGQGGSRGVSKPTRGVSEVEDMLTVRMRQRHSDVARIGIETGLDGLESVSSVVLEGEQSARTREDGRGAR